MRSRKPYKTLAPAGHTDGLRKTVGTVLQDVTCLTSVRLSDNIGSPGPPADAHNTRVGKHHPLRRRLQTALTPFRALRICISGRLG